MSSITKIHLATDHAGFDLKEEVKAYLNQEGYDVIDHGAYEYNKDDDYPDFIHKAARAVANSQGTRGIIFGYSGQGEAMTANRYAGVRAAVYYSPSAHGSSPRDDIIRLSREHNDANVLSIGAGFIEQEQVIAGIDRWLEIEFSDAQRHKRRIEKMDNPND